MDERRAPLEKPPVRTTASGVHQVSPTDILRSEAGRTIIRDVVRSGVGRTKASDAGRSPRG